MTDTSSALSRRTLLAGLAATPVLTAAPAGAQMPAAKTAAEQAQAALKDAKGTKLVLLGTGAGPGGQGPERSRKMTSHVMLSNGAAYVLDCGVGVIDQYARTGIPLARIFARSRRSYGRPEFKTVVSIEGWCTIRYISRFIACHKWSGCLLRLVVEVPGTNSAKG